MSDYKKSRVQEKSLYEKIREYIEHYAYVETLIIVAIYLAIGYSINNEDPCMLMHEVPYVVMLLAIVTLFHGFENGVFAVTVISFIMWLVYPSFLYIEFLVALVMTLIFSQFHYYWTSRIKEAEIIADFKSDKLSELSRAFYSLKVSHDQLEKNYVIKPMSIRNSINQVLEANEKALHDDEVEDKTYEYNKNFLELLDRSFNMQRGFIIYPKYNDVKVLTKDNIEIVSLDAEETIDKDTILDQYIIDKAIARKSHIYISDEQGEPSTVVESQDNNFLAALPSLVNNKIASVLVIEKMPFMFFNRENLTSISILHDYLTIENRKTELAYTLKGFELIEDKDFRFELARLRDMNKNYKVNSVTLVLRIDNELQSARVYEKIERMLRSLDMVTLVKNAGYYYIVILLPLHDKSSAQGLLNRLLNTLKDEKDKNFDHMIFNMGKLDLLSKYIKEDYNG